MPMAEVRPRVLRGGVQIRAGGVGARYLQLVGVGTGIFRGMARASQEVSARRVLSPEENKENIPPPPPPQREGSGTPRSRSQRKPNKKSPLPVWYFRTPLRDITAIVSAMEKRRTRLRVAAARQSQSTGSPLQQESLGSPLDPALGASSPADEAVSRHRSSVASPPASVQKALSSFEEIPKANKESGILPQHSSTAVSIVKAVTPSSSGSAAVRSPGKNLVDHIDVITKLIRSEELRKEAAGAVKPKSVKRSTLLSMR